MQKRKAENPEQKDGADEPQKRSKSRRNASKQTVQQSHYVDVKTVKCGRRRLIPDDHPFLVALERVLVPYSRFLQGVSYIMHGWVLWSLHEDNALPAAWTQNMMFGLLKFFRGKHAVPQNEHERDFAEYKRRFWPDLTFDEQLLTVAMIRPGLVTLITAIQNTWFKLEQRLKGQLKYQLPPPKKGVPGAGIGVDLILGRKVPKATKKLVQPDLQTLVTKYRDWLGLKPQQKATPEWMKKRMLCLLKVEYRLLKERDELELAQQAAWEQAPPDRRREHPPELKRFKLMPQFSYKRQHMLIDTDILYTLYKRTLPKKRKRERQGVQPEVITKAELATEAGQQKLWHWLFQGREQKLLTRKKHFNYSMRTDGVSIGLLFWTPGRAKGAQPKREAQEDEEEFESSSDEEDEEAEKKAQKPRSPPSNMASQSTGTFWANNAYWDGAAAPIVLGWDPGQIVGATVTGEDDSLKCRLTRDEFYVRSGCRAHQKRREQERQRNGVEAVESRMLTWKVWRHQDFMAAAQFQRQHEEALWAYYSDPAHNHDRLHQFRGKQQVVDRFVMRHVLRPGKRQDKHHLRQVKAPARLKPRSERQKRAQRQRNARQRRKRQAFRQRVVVAYGSANFSHTMKGGLTGVAGRLGQSLDILGRRMLTSEYLSSQQCARRHDGHCTGQEKLSGEVPRYRYVRNGQEVSSKDRIELRTRAKMLRQQRRLRRLQKWKGSEPVELPADVVKQHGLYKSWSVRRCPTCRTFWDRDCNAGVNIRHRGMEEMATTIRRVL